MVLLHSDYVCSNEGLKHDSEMSDAIMNREKRSQRGYHQIYPGIAFYACLDTST